MQNNVFFKKFQNKIYLLEFKDQKIYKKSSKNSKKKQSLEFIFLTRDI